MIVARNLSLGWLYAMDHLFTCDGKDTNVMVVIENIKDEYIQVRNLLDAFLLQKEEAKGETEYSMSTIANTIFPQALYKPEQGPNARGFLYHAYKENCFSVLKRLQVNSRGTYFSRMIAWQGVTGEVNQIEKVIQRLKNQLEKPNPKSSAYEIGVSIVQDNTLPTYTDEMRIYRCEREAIMNFPCLSHISLTLMKKRLHLTALYRNQHFIRKAYGNYLGLSRLLSFLCQEVGCEPGELTCIASHADAEINSQKRAVIALVEKCKAEITTHNGMQSMEKAL